MYAQPRWLDVGTVGLYVRGSELRIIKRALFIANHQNTFDHTWTEEEMEEIEAAVDSLLNKKERSDEYYERNKG